MTHSARRRQGREAFDKNTNPEDVCPYKSNIYGWIEKRQDWMDGWNEAEEAFNKSLNEPKDEDYKIQCPKCGYQDNSYKFFHK